MIAIIDYDAGNLRSVEKALIHLGQDVILTRKESELLSADKVILPGVGSFGDAMDKLHNYNLIHTIHKIIDNQIPFLGICLGMQLLFETSEESVGINGLGILEGKIYRIPAVNGLKIPHMGWNSLQIKTTSGLFKGVSENSYVYFVHSYYLKAQNEQDVSAKALYGEMIHAAVERGNIYGCQFHPEKSGDTGLKILKNFADIGRERQ